MFSPPQITIVTFPFSTINDTTITHTFISRIANRMIPKPYFASVLSKAAVKRNRGKECSRRKIRKREEKTQTKPDHGQTERNGREYNID